MRYWIGLCVSFVVLGGILGCSGGSSTPASTAPRPSPDSKPKPDSDTKPSPGVGETPRGPATDKKSDTPAVKLVKLDLTSVGIPGTIEAPEGAKAEKSGSDVKITA